jgi:hypothetical protein
MTREDIQDFYRRYSGAIRNVGDIRGYEITDIDPGEQQ